MEAPAFAKPAATQRPASMQASHSGNSGIPAYRFEPGTLLASRYRIISRLGKGGMGEVFRADDIMLGQPVALKFLSESATGNLGLLTRFYDEVRIARQITHANVCRVYDIGEVEGQPYLSMEYIDGEDLGSLLRRIGRLPADKATEFARKMCAGLAAAHKQGVLHRDLKPANVMIDGRGELHIMDFGLAAVATQLQGAEVRNGTPAYMAPEQLEGREVSAQSDLYALGLIFYEMFTGKPAHQADTVAEVLELRRSSGRITNPSQLAADIDPAVERAILRCLDPDPKQRPPSALALAASLPGGDPLAAALAAGETPSPEVVAASGSTEGLSPKVAIPALAGIVVGLVAACILMPKIQVAAYVPLENPPEALTVKAQEIVRSLGYTDAPADLQVGFYYDTTPLGEAKATGPAAWRNLIAKLPSLLLFGYRQSPAPMVSQGYSRFRHDPQATIPSSTLETWWRPRSIPADVWLLSMPFLRRWRNREPIPPRIGLCCSQPPISTWRNSSQTNRSGRPLPQPMCARPGPERIPAIRIFPSAWKPRRSTAGRFTSKSYGRRRSPRAWPEARKSRRRSERPTWRVGCGSCSSWR